MSECTVCQEVAESRHTTTIDSSTVCHGCVRHVFEMGIENEEYYPPKWGNRTLNPADFPGILPQNLLRQFEEKANEYSTPPATRLYCSRVQQVTATGEEIRCGAYVGQLVQKSTNGKAPAYAQWLQCKTCGANHCVNCGELVDSLHQCSYLTPEQMENKAFEGLEKGKHYQICPSSACGRKIELIDGCNHVECRCGQSFCFVCGQPADESHWTARTNGGCPRYNHPSTTNAMWQNEPVAWLGELRNFLNPMADNAAFDATVREMQTALNRHRERVRQIEADPQGVGIAEDEPEAHTEQLQYRHRERARWMNADPLGLGVADGEREAHTEQGRLVQPDDEVDRLWDEHLEPGNMLEHARNQRRRARDLQREMGSNVSQAGSIEEDTFDFVPERRVPRRHARQPSDRLIDVNQFLREEAEAASAGSQNFTSQESLQDVLVQARHIGNATTDQPARRGPRLQQQSNQRAQATPQPQRQLRTNLAGSGLLSSVHGLPSPPPSTLSPELNATRARRAARFARANNGSVATNRDERNIQRHRRSNAQVIGSRYDLMPSTPQGSRPLRQPAATRPDDSATSIAEVTARESARVSAMRRDSGHQRSTFTLREPASQRQTNVPQSEFLTDSGRWVAFSREPRGAIPMAEDRTPGIKSELHGISNSSQGRPSRAVRRANVEDTISTDFWGRIDRRVEELIALAEDSDMEVDGDELTLGE